MIGRRPFDKRSRTIPSGRTAPCSLALLTMSLERTATPRRPHIMTSFEIMGPKSVGDDYPSPLKSLFTWLADNRRAIGTRDDGGPDAFFLN
jgi:hypothetical protein